MKIKLDENLGRSAAEVFRRAGHDTTTVAEQEICGAADGDLIQRCRDEDRALVTLDLDFANPLHFRPSEYSGIAVLRISGPVSIAQLAELCRTLAEALNREELRDNCGSWNAAEFAFTSSRKRDLPGAPGLALFEIREEDMTVQ